MSTTLIVLMSTIAIVIYILRKETDILGKRYDVEYETDFTQGMGYAVWTYLWWADCLVAMILSFTYDDWRTWDIFVLWIGTTLLYAALVAAWSVIRKEKIDRLYSINKVYHPEHIIRALGGEIKQKTYRDNDTFIEYIVGFQGGNFQFVFKKNVRWVELSFLGFYYCQYECLNNALLAVNVTNTKQYDWICSLDVQGATDTPIVLNLTTRLALTGNLPQIKENLKELLEKAFRIAHEMRVDIERELKQQEKRDEKFFSDYTFNNKLATISRQLETHHTDEETEEDSTKFFLSVHQLVQLYEDVDLGCLLSLKMVQGDSVEHITDISAITAFDVRDYIRQHAEPTSLNSIVLIYEFEQQTLFVNLTKAKGSTDNTLYYIVNVVRSGDELDKFMDNRTSMSSRTMLEVRLGDEDKVAWEAKYMIDDAMDKMSNGKESELTDEQRLAVAHTNPTIQSNLYWGKKYFNHRCYYQALYHFNRVFRASQGIPFDDWNEDMKTLFFDISYYIGIIYADLGMNVRACYYLNIAKTSDRIDYIEAFINCLCNMRDPSTLHLVVSYIRNLQEKMNANENEIERLMPMYQFFQCRLLFLLVEYKKWDDAEIQANYMIQNDMDVEFANDELEHIRRMKIAERKEKVKRQREQRLQSKQQKQ